MECNCLYNNEDRKTVNGVVEVYCAGCGRHLYDETDEEATYYEVSLLADEIAETELDLSYAVSENRSYTDIARLVEKLGNLKRRYEAMTSP